MTAWATGVLGVCCLLGSAAAAGAPRWFVAHRSARLLGTRSAPGVTALERVGGEVRRRLGRRGRAARRRELAVLGLVEALVAELGAGLPPQAAVTAASRRQPADPLLGSIARHVELGGDAVTALREAARWPGAEGLWAVAVCLEVSARSGAGLADALRPVAGAMRDDLDLAREVAGQLAAPRATARLLAALPAVVWLLGAGLGAHPVQVLVSTPYGWACLGLGVAAEAAGLRWVDRMARSVVSG